MMSERISGKVNYPSKYVEVSGSKMHYIEAGEGDPILFLHGIPASSYVWRNVIPHLTALGKCIAPDLIGFGLSDKPPIQYTIDDHINYLAQFIEKLGLKKITLVVHGWGSIIGLDYAMKNEKQFKGLVCYEAFLRSVNDDQISLAFQEQLSSFQHPNFLNSLEENVSLFVDKIIPQQLMRQLTDEELSHYRAPFSREGAQRPLKQYLQDFLTQEGKEKLEKIIEAYSTKLKKSSLPKLMLYSIPGFITTVSAVIWAKDNFPNLEIVDIGEELHLGQESYPQLIGEAISVWLQGVEQQI